MRRLPQIATVAALALAGGILAGWRPPAGPIAQRPGPAPRLAADRTAPAVAAVRTARTAVTEDTLLHVVAAGECLDGIAARYRPRTGHWRAAELAAAIRTANALGSDLLRPGRRLVVPPAGPEPHPVVATRVRAGAGLRGIYLPAVALGAPDLFARVDAFLAAGGNGVVLDAKDADGRPTHPSAVALAAAGPAPAVRDLCELIERLHRRDAWVAARLACFLDGDLGARRPDLALRGPDGEPWRERGLTWLDPERAEVRRYLVDLALELARAGADEVQLDYVRYPTNGFPGGPARTAAITGFVAEVARALAPRGVVLSADLFGVVAWEREIDRDATGQDIAAIAGLVDVLCPMVYPSHYGPGFGGVELPGEEPERFVAEGSRRFAALAAGKALIRPWLQAFPYRAPGYGGGYVLAQIAGAAAAGADGWCLWNPGGRYGDLLAVLAGSAAPAPGSAPPAIGPTTTISLVHLDPVLH